MRRFIVFNLLVVLGSFPAFGFYCPGGSVVGRGSSNLIYSNDPWWEAKKKADEDATVKCKGLKVWRVYDYKLSSEPIFGGKIGYAEAYYHCGECISNY